MLINPIAFYIFSMPVRWYGISYSIGISLAWLYARHIISLFPSITKKNIDDFVSWSIVGIIIGGRLGHVLLYETRSYLSNPVDIIKTWNGGMSFHGGLIGVSAVSILFCIKKNIKFIDMANLLSCISPIGLFFGRVANFINQELYGKVTSVPWAVHFEFIDKRSRHPSQLYEAFLEGIVLFVLMQFLLLKKTKAPIFAYFLFLYGIFRCFCEHFKAPLEMSSIGITLGQLYSIPMLMVGVFFILYTPKRN